MRRGALFVSSYGLTFDVEHGGLRVLGAHIVLRDALVLAQVLLLAAADLQSTCERTTQKGTTLVSRKREKNIIVDIENWVTG